MICLFFDHSIFIIKTIVIFRPFHMRNRSAITNLYGFDCTYRHYGMCKFCVEFIKDGIADAGRNTCYHTFDRPAHRVFFSSTFSDIFQCFFCRQSIRHADSICINRFMVKGIIRNCYGSDGFCIGSD